MTSTSSRRHRRALGKAGEQIKLLNEQIVDVDESVLCITDDSGPIGLAGIMGGFDQGRTANANLYLESAFFFPDVSRARAAFQFFQRRGTPLRARVDFENNVAGIERATPYHRYLRRSPAGRGRANALPQRARYACACARAQVIGVPVDSGEMADISHAWFRLRARSGARS